MSSEEEVAYIPEKVALQAAQWSRPSQAWAEVDEQGEWVVRWSGTWSPVDLKDSQERMLTSFMNLTYGSPTDVAQFVELWGILDLCAHGLPTTHLPRRMWSDLDALGSYPCELGLVASRRLGFEPVERWLHFAGQALALHRVAQSILEREPVPPEIWLEMSDLYPHGWTAGDELLILSLPSEGDPSIEQRLMSIALQRWLDLGDVGIRVDWKDTQGSIAFGGSGLVGAIGVQLALTCTRSKPLFVCSVCPNLLPTTARRPAPGKRRYCSDECRKEGAARRSQEYRARKREKDNG